MSKKQKINEGEVPQYYVEGSHPAIVTAEVFDLVQYEMNRRRQLSNPYSSTSPFSSRIICGDCGGQYGSKIWDSNSKYRRVIYQCNHRHGKRAGEGLGCKTPHLTEEEIKAAFVGAFNHCITNRAEIIENCRLVLSGIIDTSKLEAEVSTLTDECNVVAELIRKCVEENAHVAVDPKAYAEKYEALAERYTKAKDRLDAVTEEIRTRSLRKEQIEEFLQNLSKSKEIVTEFDLGLWNTVIETLTVYSKDNIVVRFKGGTEIKWQIQ